MKRAVTLLLCLALFASGAAAPASGDTVRERPREDSQDPRTERERVRRQKAKAAAELDALQADAAQLEQGLADLADYVDYQGQVLDRAKADQVEANRQVELAQERVDAMAARISELDAAVKEAALRAFTSSGSSGNVFAALVSDGPTDAMQQDVLYGLVTGDIAGALDELAAAHADLRAAQRRAEAAAVRADEHRLAVEGKIADLQDAIDSQETLADKIDDRIDQTMSEAANLEQLDAKLSKEIADREAALAAKLRAARERQAQRSGSGSSGGRSDDGSSDDGSSDEDGSGDDGSSGGGSNDGGSSGGSNDGGSDDEPRPEIPEPVNGLVRINGITVDASIGPAIAQMVEWAAQDGINLTGGGFRSPEDQIAVRKANCGSSYYDIWQKPSSQCRPPAARPGKSMHEKGLAVDFACNGQLVSNYSHWCYEKLASWARRVGLKNRGVEAWHWSTNGN